MKNPPDIHQRLREALQALQQTQSIHPAKVVVLLPFGQLLGVFASAWAAHSPNGFTPRFETTRTWARALGDLQGGLVDTSALQGDDFRHDMALDTLTAHSLLARAGLSAWGADLCPALLQAAAALAGVAAAVPPAERAAWGERVTLAWAEVQGQHEAGQTLRFEAAITQIALVWVANSSFATDVLFDSDTMSDAKSDAISGVDRLIVVTGLQVDPLADALASQFVDTQFLPLLDLLDQPAQGGETEATEPFLKLCAAPDFEEEALWAAACVIHHAKSANNVPIAPTAPTAPIALVANDRLLTRRVAAMLHGQGIVLHDETGWTLSTTRAAASVLTQLMACSPMATSDAVLDALKNAPTASADLVAQIEAHLRRARCHLWRDRGTMPLDAPALTAFIDAWQTQFTRLQAPRAWADWQQDVVALLQFGGLWPVLQADAAGQALINALHWDGVAQSRLADWPLAGKRMGYSECVAWVRQVLESASFVPPRVGSAGSAGSAPVQVVILPLAQLVARRFSAIVIPGCDETQFNPSPTMPGSWTSAERAALGLPSREAVQLALAQAWAQAHGAANTVPVDILWRSADTRGEALLPSPFVQSLLHRLQRTPSTQIDDRLTSHTLPTSPTPAPQAHGQALPVIRLSASAYEDLRHCPYRFFALRQLGLSEASELDATLEKRDIGDWLHEVLKEFHQRLAALAEQTPPAPDTPDTRRQLLDDCAAAARAKRSFGHGDFLPYAAAWPAQRDAYLRWLAGHDTTGQRFAQAEIWHEMPAGPVTLVGRIDRVDMNTEGDVLVLDYKTESPTRSKTRVADPTEDTQLAFYAALFPNDSLRAAYLNVNESAGTQLFEQTAVVEVRDELITGIVDDLQRIAGGATLAALGEGVACDYCAARGLCRKDFWEMTV